VASSGTVETLLSSVQDTPLRLTLLGVFRYLLGSLTFGRATGSTQSAASLRTPADNFGAIFVKGTTAPTANKEFAVPHSLGRSPYLLIPVLPLDQVNAQIVPLTLSRVADATNVYLKSSSTSAPIYLYLEG
jgi:hypothetical protein